MKLKCQLCGIEYREEDSKQSCGGCAMSNGCGLLRCPNCGYENPKESRFINRILKRRNSNEDKG